jgi:2-deoxy-D-gluconate 3-dehydrogenase
LAKYGINVNAIAPGFMVTEMTQPLKEDAARNEAILKRVPAGRWGETEDLKGLVVFLASSASDFLNGSIINVDGGWLAA